MLLFFDKILAIERVFNNKWCRISLVPSLYGTSWEIHFLNPSFYINVCYFYIPFWICYISFFFLYECFVCIYVLIPVGFVSVVLVAILCSKFYKEFWERELYILILRLFKWYFSHNALFSLEKSHSLTY